jgi:hypothetical protein
MRDPLDDLIRNFGVLSAYQGQTRGQCVGMLGEKRLQMRLYAIFLQTWITAEFVGRIVVDLAQPNLQSVPVTPANLPEPRERFTAWHGTLPGPRGL